MDTQKLLIFELQLCLINHGNWTGSWNLVIMTLYDTSTHATHMFWETVCQAPWNNIDHFCYVKVFILRLLELLENSFRLRPNTQMFFLQMLDDKMLKPNNENA